MKKGILFFILLIVSLPILGRRYDPEDALVIHGVNRYRANHRVSAIAPDDIFRTKAFRIDNRTGHEVELTIEYGACLPNKFRIGGDLVNGYPRRMDVWKQGGCVARRISGKINFGGDWIDIKDPRNPTSGYAWQTDHPLGIEGAGAHGAQWEIYMIAPKRAYVRFIRNSSYPASPSFP